MGIVASETVSRIVISLQAPVHPAAPGQVEDEPLEVPRTPLAPPTARAGAAAAAAAVAPAPAAAPPDDIMNNGGWTLVYGIIQYSLSCLLTMYAVPVGDAMGDAIVDLALATDLWGLPTNNVSLGLDARGRFSGSSLLFWHSHPVVSAACAAFFLACIAVIVARFAFMADAVLAVVQTAGIEVRKASTKGGDAASPPSPPPPPPSAQWHVLKIATNPAVPAEPGVVQQIDTLFAHFNGLVTAVKRALNAGPAGGRNSFFAVRQRMRCCYLRRCTSAHSCLRHPCS